jgi:hypothetical protein
MLYSQQFPGLGSQLWDNYIGSGVIELRSAISASISVFLAGLRYNANPCSCQPGIHSILRPPNSNVSSIRAFAGSIRQQICSGSEAGASAKKAPLSTLRAFLPQLPRVVTLFLSILLCFMSLVRSEIFLVTFIEGL